MNVRLDTQSRPHAPLRSTCRLLLSIILTKVTALSFFISTRRYHSYESLFWIPGTHSLFPDCVQASTSLPIDRCYHHNEKHESRTTLRGIMLFSTTATGDWYCSFRARNTYSLIEHDLNDPQNKFTNQGYQHHSTRATFVIVGIWFCIALVHCFIFTFSCGVLMVRAGFWLFSRFLCITCAFGILTTPIHTHRHGGYVYEQSGMGIWASSFVHM
jgi:hypothetical protein